MLDLPVTEGALFYGAQRRREQVVFDDALRARTESLVGELRSLFDLGVLTPPRYGAHCRSCSLVEVCRPTLYLGRSASAWTERMRTEQSK